ncbi:MAG: hypothetical protein LBQ05_01280 [Christensenellaceae bacterium]|jgi:hypothetical protein|nr:hypothetical protein [Christensenellaceae bacterium]
MEEKKTKKTDGELEKELEQLEEIVRKSDTLTEVNGMAQIVNSKFGLNLNFEIKVQGKPVECEMPLTASYRPYKQGIRQELEFLLKIKKTVVKAKLVIGQGKQTGYVFPYYQIMLNDEWVTPCQVKDDERTFIANHYFPELFKKDGK